MAWLVRMCRVLPDACNIQRERKCGNILAPGIYTGQIIFTAYDRSQSIAVPVTLTVVAAAVPFFGGTWILSFVSGSSFAPSPQTLQITNAGSGTLELTATTTMFNGTPGVTWFSFAASECIAPAILTINVSPQGLSPGLYLGQILLQAASGNITIPVSLEVAGASNAVFQQPAPLNFTVPVGGLGSVTTDSDNQQHRRWLCSNSAEPSTSSGGNWLGWSGCSGDCPMPAIFSVSACGCFGSGNLHRSDYLLPPTTGHNRSPCRWTLTVVAAAVPFFGGTPGSLSFVSGSSFAPFATNIADHERGERNSELTATTTMFNGTLGVTWLSFAASGGIAPAILTINVSPQGLSPGLYLTTSPVSCERQYNNLVSFGGGRRL